MKTYTRFLLICLFLICSLFFSLYYIMDDIFDEYKYLNIVDNTNDSLITSIIKIKFTLDAREESSNIKVSTENGIVTLKGNVKEHNHIEYIVDLIKDIRGVKQVVSEIIVENNEVEIPIEFEDGEVDNDSNTKYFIKNIKKTKRVLSNLIHYKTKILDLLINHYISEDKSEYVITAILPSINYKDINIFITKNDILVISGYIVQDNQEDLEYFSMIKSYGFFEKSIILPNYCELKNARAFFKNKTLTIHIPKL